VEENRDPNVVEEEKQSKIEFDFEGSFGQKLFVESQVDRQYNKDLDADLFPLSDITPKDLQRYEDRGKDILIEDDNLLKSQNENLTSPKIVLPKLNITDLFENTPKVNEGWISHA
jgi:hypothetical protein